MDVTLKAYDDYSFANLFNTVEVDVYSRCCEPFLGMNNVYKVYLGITSEDYNIICSFVCFKTNYDLPIWAFSNNIYRDVNNNELYVLICSEHELAHNVNVGKFVNTNINYTLEGFCLKNYDSCRCNMLERYLLYNANFNARGVEMALQYDSLGVALDLIRREIIDEDTLMSLFDDLPMFVYNKTKAMYLRYKQKKGGKI